MSLQDVEREKGWPLANMKDQFQIAKFGKHTLDVPNIIAAYYDRIYKEEGTLFDKEACIDGLIEKILIL